MNDKAPSNALHRCRSLFRLAIPEAATGLAASCLIRPLICSCRTVSSSPKSMMHINSVGCRETMIDTSTALQTVAALSSAVAATAAFWVARSAFTFQKNSLLKTATVEQIVKLLQQLYYLKSLAGQPVFGACDEDVTWLGHRIAEVKRSHLQLAATVPAKAGKEMEKVHAIVHGLHEGWTCNGFAPVT